MYILMIKTINIKSAADIYCIETIVIYELMYIIYIITHFIGLVLSNTLYIYIIYTSMLKYFIIYIKCII